MKYFRTYINPVGATRLDFDSPMKMGLKNVIMGSLLTALLHWGVGDLSAQGNAASGDAAASGGEGMFKKLLVAKFDTSLDGSLTGREKASAVDFLKKQDKDKDGQISLSERTAAMVELNKMPKLGRDAAMEAMTPEDRNAAKRDASWGEFIKKLPHSTEGRSFTKLPGDPGFKMQGDGFVDPTKLRGAAPKGDRITSKELEELMSNAASKDRLKKQQLGAKPLKKADKPVEKLGARDYYAGTTILVVGDEHSVVPQGAVINVPPKLTSMVAKKPHGKLVIWPEFVKKHSYMIATKEVSWQTAKGEDPLTDKEKRLLSVGGKLVVAVFGNNPISVMPPKPKKELVEEVVDGALTSDGTKKRR